MEGQYGDAQVVVVVALGNAECHALGICLGTPIGGGGGGSDGLPISVVSGVGIDVHECPDFGMGGDMLQSWFLML